jgi:hypothetical protein
VPGSAKIQRDGTGRGIHWPLLSLCCMDLAYWRDGAALNHAIRSAHPSIRSAYPSIGEARGDRSTYDDHSSRPESYLAVSASHPLYYIIQRRARQDHRRRTHHGLQETRTAKPRRTCRHLSHEPCEGESWMAGASYKSRTAGSQCAYHEKCQPEALHVLVRQA